MLSIQISLCFVIAIPLALISMWCVQGYATWRYAALMQSEPDYQQLLGGLGDTLLGLTCPAFTNVVPSICMIAIAMSMVIMWIKIFSLRMEPARMGGG